MAVLDRIRLQRSVAVVTEDSITVRPAGRFVAPLIQALIAGGSVALIALLLSNNGPIWLLMLLLIVALLLGPAAVLGLVYSVAGSSVTIEREKQSVRFQQGFLGLGLGTAELVPFWRIARIEVDGDYSEELTSGERQDLAQWEVVLVKDNDRRLVLGTVIAAQSLAAEALDRVNRLATAVAHLTGVQAHTAALPPEAVEDGVESPRPRRARRRTVRTGRRPPPPPANRAHEREGARMERAVELMRDAKTIAVVGVSPRPERDSHDVARYLIDAGYTVYLVNPTAGEMLGRPVYDRVQDLPEPVDIVDVFRRPEHVPPVVDDAIAAGAKAVWMQLGIVHEAAAERARASGLEVVMDRCTKVEHMRLQALRQAGDETAG